MGLGKPEFGCLMAPQEGRMWALGGEDVAGVKAIDQAHRWRFAVR